MKGLATLGPAILLSAMVLLGAPSVQHGDLSAQSVLERTPNLAGAWVGRPRTLYLDLLHRFRAGEGADRVDGAPSFLTGLGVGGYGLVGVRYAHASPLVAGHSDEWEVLVRLSPFSTALGSAFEIGLTGAFNEVAESFDSEFALAVPFGRLKLMGAARLFTNAYGSSDSRWAFGGGMRLRLHRRFALAGDIITPTSKREGEGHGWSAALQIAVPSTPMTVSVQAANTSSGSLQGSSIRSSGTRLGVALNVPIAPSQYFGQASSAGSGGVVSQRTGESDFSAGDTVVVSIRDDEFAVDAVVVPEGAYVHWVVEGDEPHSTTSDDGSWDSRLLGPGESFGRVFSEAGEYAYHCTLHSSERAVVVVGRGNASGPS